MVGAGGFAGSVLRFLVGLLVTRLVAHPLLWLTGTLVVNLLGGVLIGWLASEAEGHNLSDSLGLLLIVGFCGGFTTFSTLAKEMLDLLQREEFFAFVLYSSIHFVGGILAVWAGYSLARL